MVSAFGLITEGVSRACAEENYYIQEMHAMLGCHEPCTFVVNRVHRCTLFQFFPQATPIST
jgi:hypothetical protein